MSEQILDTVTIAVNVNSNQIVGVFADWHTAEWNVRRLINDLNSAQTNAGITHDERPNILIELRLLPLTQENAKTIRRNVWVVPGKVMGATNCNKSTE